MALDYAKRLERMQSRLDKEIKKNVVGKDTIKVKATKDKIGPAPVETLLERLDRETKEKN